MKHAWAQGLWQGTLDLWAGARCGLCGRNAPQALCQTCVEAVTVPHARHVVGLGEVRVLGRYSGLLRQGILNAKFGGRPNLIRLLAQLLATRLKGLDVEAVLFVPMGPWREAVRGFNQARLIAEVIGRGLGRPVSFGGLATGPRRVQSRLSAGDRHRNVAGKFRAGRGLRIEGTVLLVDDVVTTGATLLACRRVLADAGLSEVACAALAAT